MNERNLKNNHIYNSIKKNNILRNKLKQRSKTVVSWKLQHTAEKQNKRKRHPSRIHELEDLILLHCP